MGTHCWTVATALTSSACSQPHLRQLRWSLKQEESGCWPARLMTTFRVGHLTFNLCVTYDLSALRFYQLCRVADRGECIFVRHPAAILSEVNLTNPPTAELVFLLLCFKAIQSPVNLELNKPYWVRCLLYHIRLFTMAYRYFSAFLRKVTIYLFICLTN